MRYSAIPIILLLFFTGLGITAVAQSSAELQKQRERLDREIRQLNESLSVTTTDKTLTLRQVNILNAQLKLREQKIATINSEIRILTNQIAGHAKAIKDLEAELTQLREDYEQMVLFAFRNKNSYNVMMFIFAASDFNQAFKRVKYLQQLNESRKKKSEEIESTQQEISLKVAQLEASKSMQASLLAEQQKERSEINNERGEESRALRSLTQQEKQFQDEINKRQQELTRLARAINAAIAKEMEEQRLKAEAERLAAAKREAERTGKTIEQVEEDNPELRPKSGTELLMATPAAAKLSAGFASNKGRLPWPVKNGVVTLGFGRHLVGVSVTNPHEGIRIHTNANMQVTSVFEGEVRMAMPVPGLGYIVLINHGKYYTLYGNLKSLTVKKGDKVTTGHVLGTAITDSEGLTEVYFEVMENIDGQNPQRQNPEQWLAR